MLNSLLPNELRRIADDIESGNCGLTSDEQLELLSHVAHQKLNKTEAADLLNMSTRNFDRKITAGEFPEGRKSRGSNSLFWYRDELLSKIEQ